MVDKEQMQYDVQQIISPLYKENEELKVALNSIRDAVGEVTTEQLREHIRSIVDAAILPSKGKGSARTVGRRP